MPPVNYAYLDERQGVWTRVVVRTDRVEFRPTLAYVLGAAVALLLIAPLSAWLAISLLGMGPLGWVMGAFVVSIMFAIVKSALRRPAPIVVVEAAAAEARPRKKRGRIIISSDIAGIIIRENHGRTAEDTALAQVYLLLCGSDSPLLAYQQYLGRDIRRVRAVAAMLAERWKVAISDETGGLGAPASSEQRPEP